MGDHFEEISSANAGESISLEAEFLELDFEAVGKRKTNKERTVNKKGTPWKYTEKFV